MSEKLEYEKAIDEFLETDKKYTNLEEQFMSGELLGMVIDGAPGTIDEEMKNNIIEQFKAMIDEFKNLLEERNTKLQNAKNSLRQFVQLAPSQWRGRDGKPSVTSYGSFHVSSVTRRWLDGEALMQQARSKGLEKDLRGLESVDKNGKKYRLVQEKYEIDYDLVTKWLIDHGHEDVVDASYDEKEATAQVKGPKALAFFGEKKGD